MACLPALLPHTLSLPPLSLTSASDAEDDSLRESLVRDSFVRPVWARVSGGSCAAEGSCVRGRDGGEGEGELRALPDLLRPINACRLRTAIGRR